MNSAIQLAFIHSFQTEFIIFSLLILFLLFFSLFISGAQHALFSITPNELEELERTSKWSFRHTQQLIARPRHLLVLVEILQTVNTVLILFLSVKIGLHFFAGTPASWLKYGLHAILLVFILLIFQEIIPKFFGGSNNLLWARYMSTPIFLLGKVFYPFTETLINASYFVERKFAGERKEHEEKVMEKPEDQMAQEAEGAQDFPILKGILKFGSISVRQIMKSRIDMVCVDEQTSFTQLLKMAKEFRYSRFPVFRENIDNMRGVIYTKDLLPFMQTTGEQNWQQLIREVHFVPEGKRIAELLPELQREQNHLAIVIDEYGRTAGLVTLEDILEEIIGEIKDETDERNEVEYIQVDAGTFEFEGKTALSDFCSVLNLPSGYFEEVQSESDSLGGLLLELAGTIPAANDRIQFKDLVFVVLSLENYRIRKVKVIRRPERQVSV